MPKPSPKRRVDPDDPTRTRSRYHNRRRIKRIAIGACALAIVVGLIAWNLVATFPDTRPGDTVRVQYQVWTADGTLVEGSNDLTVYVDLAQSPKTLYSELAHAKIGVPQSFAVPACPTANCTDYGGYTSGPHAWQAIRGTVTVLAILNR